MAPRHLDVKRTAIGDWVASLITRDNQVSSLPGIWKYPSLRDEPLKSAPLWLEGRRKDEDVGELWRVHDHLYDFSQWMQNHPGGSDWLEMTRGTDITEAFEAHHIAQTAELLLPHFRVRPATTPRNSPYTFREDGFYRTLKARAREALKGPKGQPSRARLSRRAADALLAAALLLAAAAGARGSLALGAAAGFFLALTVISAHNFFHQKDNFRMYYFDLSLMSSRDWRVSHALSHHLFTNTILDLEISLFEPLIQYLPDPNKSWWGRYGPWIYSPVLYAFMFHGQFVVRMLLYLHRLDKGPRKEDFFPLVIPLVIYTYGGCGLVQALLMWQWITICASFTFSLIGLNAAHHHPEIFHDGDKPRDDLDWGVQQLDAVQDRPWVSRWNFLALTTFGHHGLHHLFPTLDHARLDALVPVVERTCREFGAEYTANTVLGLVKGQFLQAARVRPNPRPPGRKAR